ncbi:MAG: sugar phosphate isomerase/epimerase [Clostridia bacterium]|nr:sugar phosphate isomerase/epimerase [Clostridia bacterium]
MISVSCCIPGGSFMPEGEGAIPMSPYERLVNGCEVIKNLGYDTAEATVGLVLGLTEEETAHLAEERKAGRFSLEVCNSFIPGDYPVVTDEEGTKKLYAYADRAFARMHALGVKILVFGSGKARSIPENIPYAEGEAKIDAFLAHCNDLCETYGMTLVIEPLNRRETNWVRTVRDGAKVVRRVNLPHIRLLADGFHMACEEEGPEAMAENKDILIHTHLACAPDRVYPGKTDGKYETAFLKTLHDMDYQGIVTVECGFTDFAGEAKLAAEFIRGTLKTLA